MKWIELIRVRSSPATLERAMPALARQVRDIERSSPDIETHFMQHALFAGDLAIVVIWQTQTPPGKTREGLLLAEGLEHIGTVDHAVWVPTSQPVPTQSTPQSTNHSTGKRT